VSDRVGRKFRFSDWRLGVGRAGRRSAPRAGTRSARAVCPL